MGWAELLMRLEIPYDSDKAIGLGEQIMQFIQQKSFDASAELAKQRGVFPNWEKSIYAPSTPLRNATRTSIAPTGTISIIADTSSSIEPLYALAFRRDHVLNEESLLFVNQVFFSYLQKHGLYSERIVDQIINEGMVRHIEGLPVSAKHIFRTALEIAPAWHLRHQLAFQKYTDNAVSKTINLPESADMNEVSEIYKLAWRQKARGITIYRNRSKERQVLQKGIKTGTKGCRICIEQ
jgi:ribonucleoside-diphosphate reductase alpha chain